MMGANIEGGLFVGADAGEVKLRFEDVEIAMSPREAELLAFGLVEMADAARQ